MLKASRTHLADVGETYLEHMRFAFLVGVLALGAGLACILHAIVPALCERTCSRAVDSLQRLFADRSQLGAVLGENSGLIIFVLLMSISCLTAFPLAIAMAGKLVGIMVLPQAFALPLVFLSQNPGLETVAP